MGSKTNLVALSAGLVLIVSCSALAEEIYSFTARDIDGNDVSLEKYRGKALLIVNVASW